MKLDFSEFHPTSDHWPFTPHCRQFYGGGWVHLRYAWAYHRRDQVTAPFRRALSCPWGRHRMQTWYQHGRPIRVVCQDCSHTRLPSEKDIDETPEAMRRFHRDFG